MRRQQTLTYAHKRAEIWIPVPPVYKVIGITSFHGLRQVCGVYQTAGFMILYIAYTCHRATTLGGQPVVGNEYDLEISSS